MWGKAFKVAVGAGTVYRYLKDRAIQQENEARFMSAKEEKQFFSARHQGLLLDGRDRRLSHDQSFRNLAVVANTGSGKSATFIIPNLLSVDDASMVVTDPSGVLFERTGHDLKRRGYDVLKLDPLDLMGSLRYNPLARASTFVEMNEIAHILVHTENQGSRTEAIWLNGAQDIIAILIKCLKNHRESFRYANLANLHYLLLSFGNGEPLFPFVTDNAPDQATFQAFKGFVSQADRTMQGMVSQAKSSLSMLADPDIARITGTNSFSFEQLRQRRTAVFLVFPQNRISYYSFLMNLLYTQLFHYCLDDRAYDARSLPVYFLLDEFGHLRIPDFPSIITTTRQRRISISIVLQAVSQLVERYGRDGANTILNGGIANRLFYSVSDLEAAEDISRIIGDVFTNHVDLQGNYRTEHQRMMTANALMAMPPTKALYMPSGMRAAQFDVTRYFERGDFNRRAQARPINTPRLPVPEVDLLTL